MHGVLKSRHAFTTFKFIAGRQEHELKSVKSNSNFKPSLYEVKFPVYWNSYTIIFQNI